MRHLGSVAHIEDIAVAKDQQGKKLGLKMIHALDDIAEKVGCYKAILDCSDKNQGFYEKCGYRLAGVQMVGSAFLPTLSVLESLKRHTCLSIIGALL